MAQRIWFPAAPVSGVSASDRAQIAIGYSGIVIEAPAQVAPPPKYLLHGFNRYRLLQWGGRFKSY